MEASHEVGLVATPHEGACVNREHYRPSLRRHLSDYR